MEQLVRVIAAAFGLTAFAVATLAGLMAGNPASHVLIVSIACALVGRIVGTIAGLALSHVVGQHLDHYKLDHPIPVLLSSNTPVMEVGDAEPDPDAASRQTSAEKV